MTALTVLAEPVTPAIVLLAPIAFGIASLFVSRRRMRLRILLAVPALLIGFFFTWALVPRGPGYGGIYLLLYGPVLMILGIAGLTGWRPGRAPESDA